MFLRGGAYRRFFREGLQVKRPLEHAEQEPVVAVLERLAEARVPSGTALTGQGKAGRTGLDLALQELNDEKNGHVHYSKHFTHFQSTGAGGLE